MVMTEGTKVRRRGSGGSLCSSCVALPSRTSGGPFTLPAPPPPPYVSSEHLASFRALALFWLWLLAFGFRLGFDMDDMDDASRIIPTSDTRETESYAVCAHGNIWAVRRGCTVAFFNLRFMVGWLQQFLLLVVLI